jgi:hypothetical protein
LELLRVQSGWHRGNAGPIIHCRVHVSSDSRGTMSKHDAEEGPSFALRRIASLLWHVPDRLAACHELSPRQRLVSKLELLSNEKTDEGWDGESVACFREPFLVLGWGSKPTGSFAMKFFAKLPLDSTKN